MMPRRAINCYPVGLRKAELRPRVRSAPIGGSPRSPAPVRRWPPGPLARASGPAKRGLAFDRAATRSRRGSWFVGRAARVILDPGLSEALVETEKGAVARGCNAPSATTNPPEHQREPNQKRNGPNHRFSPFPIS